MARVCLHGDLQRFGCRFSLSIKTGAEAIYALAMQIPGFRQKMNAGWYQIRIAGQDVDETSVSARLHESLPDGAIIHIVPRMAGAGKGGLFGGAGCRGNRRILFNWRGNSCSLG